MSSTDNQESSRNIPLATYRLQFNHAFTLQQAVEILDYLKELGVSTIYASPLFAARPDSAHGYDVCDFNRINPQIGTAEDFEQFTWRLGELGLGLMIDMVPNHMAAELCNPWWHDVLKHGRDSKYATFFDIDWESRNPSLRDKVLLPVLEDDYAEVLQSGKLRLLFEEEFVIGYHDRRFPIAPGTLSEQAVGDLQRVVDQINGKVGEPHSWDRLDTLLQRQHYCLASWRVREKNYRRFFDVNDLVALRMELPDVFTATHRMVLNWLKQNKIAGLRIDHPDGLWNPKQYFERLQAAAAVMRGVSLAETVPTMDRDTTCSSPEQCVQPDLPLYVVVEKILCHDESLPTDWRVAGTTGYDFLNRANGLFVNPANAAMLDSIYREFTGCRMDFKEDVTEAKQKILETSFGSELESLTHRLHQLTLRAHSEMEFSPLQEALKAIIAAFPVYRTYLTEQSLQPSADQATIQKSVSDATARNPQIDPTMFRFMEDILTLKRLPDLDPESAALARMFLMRFQQLTGPVMAKGVEDTAFYDFNRLISLNEVGGNPDAFGESVEAFHNFNSTTAARWPHTLLATATHDTKRGEDARARINVLSEIPGEWQSALSRWSALNSDKQTGPGNRPTLSRNDEYLLYQSLVGAWPSEADHPNGLKTFRERLSAFMLKAVREARSHTSWTDPNQAYEQSVQDFIARLLAEGANPFLEGFRKFHRRIRFFAQFNSLGQTLLKLTSPGVPDLYQGTELCDLSFVDPDNRRPVDYESRKKILTDLKARLGADIEKGENIFTRPEAIDLAQIKIFLIWRSLDLRHQQPDVFTHGSYDPLPAFGTHKDHLCAFARCHKQKTVIVLVPRLVCTLTAGKEIQPRGNLWKDTVLPLSDARTGDSFRNAFTGETVSVVEHDGIQVLQVSEVLRNFPVALLHN